MTPLQRYIAEEIATDHVDGLPFGTRGGLLVRHHFPVDGEYVIKPKLWRNTVDVVRGTGTSHTSGGDLNWPV